ncbi:MAG: EamA family transporter [Thermodesulfobacteria bacterium]|nr:EamA family transporter [Thermodesulfobacteriota bacterium]
MEGRVLLLWLLTLFFWGSTPLFEKVALRGTDPLVALTLRTGLAALILCAATFFTGKAALLLSLSLKDYLALGISGLFAGVLGMFTYFSLLKSGAASKIVPLTAAYPLVTALCAALFLQEKITLLRLLGISLTILGLIILQRS